MTNKPESIETIRRRVAGKIARMTKEEAEAYLFAHRVYVGGRPNGTINAGGRLGDPGIRFLTGGYSSQSLDGYVIRYLAFRVGRVKIRPNFSR